MPLETSPEQPVPVRTVARLIGDWVARLGRVWVEGQVAQRRRRPGRGHGVPHPARPGRRVSLHGDGAPAVLDAVVPPLVEGARVVVHAKPDFWLAAGHAVARGRPRSARSASASCWPGSSGSRRCSPPRGCSSPAASGRCRSCPAGSAWSAGAARPPSATSSRTPGAAGRRSSSACENVAGAGRLRRHRGHRRAAAARPRPGGRRDRRSRAAAGRSRTCCRSPTRRWCGRWPPAARRWSAPSATSRTPRCSTSSPTCAPRRRPTRPGGSCPTSREELAGLRRARAGPAPGGRRGCVDRGAAAGSTRSAAGPCWPTRSPRWSTPREADVAALRRPGPPHPAAPPRPGRRRARAHPGPGPVAVPGGDPRARVRRGPARRTGLVVRDPAEVAVGDAAARPAGRRRARPRPVPTRG